MMKDLKEPCYQMPMAVIVALISTGILFDTLWLCGVRDFSTR